MIRIRGCTISIGVGTIMRFPVFALAFALAALAPVSAFAQAAVPAGSVGLLNGQAQATGLNTPAHALAKGISYLSGSNAMFQYYQYANGHLALDAAHQLSVPLDTTTAPLVGAVTIGYAAAPSSNSAACTLTLIGPAGSAPFRAPVEAPRVVTFSTAPLRSSPVQITLPEAGAGRGVDIAVAVDLDVLRQTVFLHRVGQ